MRTFIAALALLMAWGAMSARAEILYRPGRVGEDNGDSGKALYGEGRPDYIGSTLCHSRGSLFVMEPFPTIRLTRQEMERAVLDLGVKFATVRQWRYRGVPTRWQIRLMKHFGGMILIDDVASADLPPVKQRTLADICREKFLTPSGQADPKVESGKAETAG